MADGVNFNLVGMEDLLGKFHEVSHDIRRKGGRYALRKAAQVIREAAKQGATRVDDPRSPEKISANIVERWSGRRFKLTGDLMFRVGVLGGAKGYAKASGELQGAGKQNPGGDTFHWRFLEFGTEHMQAQPFMRPAMQKSINAATNTFISEYDKALGRALKRAKKKDAPK